MHMHTLIKERSRKYVRFLRAEQIKNVAQPDLIWLRVAPIIAGPLCRVRRTVHQWVLARITLRTVRRTLSTR